MTLGSNALDLEHGQRPRQFAAAAAVLSWTVRILSIVFVSAAFTCIRYPNPLLLDVVSMSMTILPLITVLRAALGPIYDRNWKRALLDGAFGLAAWFAGTLAVAVSIHD